MTDTVRRSFLPVMVLLLAVTLMLILRQADRATSATLNEPLVAQATAPTDLVTYREGVIGRVGRLNPLLANLNPVDADITALIFEGLTRINQFGEPVGALAKEWVISADSLEYVFTLRDDVLWQDGTPFTADDVVFTMALLRSPDFPGDPALNRFWRTVETQRLGDHLVRFRLTQPLASFLDELRIGILPQHALIGMPPDQLAAHPFNLSPVGTGAYQLSALRTSDGTNIDIVELVRAPVYRQRPEGQDGFAIERLSFHLYDSFDQALSALDRGEIDGLAARNRQERAPLNRRADAGAVQVLNGIEPTTGFLIFNWRRDDLPVFQEQRVRQAFMTAVNRNALVERYLFNFAIPANSPIPLTSWAHGDSLPDIQQNLAAARENLAAARLNLPEPPEPDELTEDDAPDDPPADEEPMPDDGTLFSIRLLTPDDTALVGLADEVAGWWSQIGVGVTVDVATPRRFRERLAAGDFEVALVELTRWGTADPDVYAFWHQGQVPPEGENYGGADDRGISELLERARRDPNGINRAELYQRFQREFIERAIAIPLYHPLYTYAHAPNVGGVQLGFIGEPADRFKSIADWTITR